MALSGDRSSTALVAIGWPICRLVPWPMISSGCSAAIAARTACSTSPASRIFRISNRLRPSTSVSAVPFAADLASNHPSIGVAGRHKAGAGAASRELQSHFDRDRTIYGTVRRLSNCIAAIGAISPPSNMQGSDT